eukprot:TRINITY_DN1359_c0_g2_i2.p1 TRINITY_DN1359_c0_g2~~TRINITY_DN1359_c0_g2_i2.p1  ORF type:complete len:247 (+),score=52.67 TRINITY_DN1359_c0_g2_i2:74-814(+)
MTDAQRPLKAVVFGATGAVGKWVVHELLSSSKFSQVVTVTRRYASYPGYESADGKSVHPKLVQVVADYENLSAVADQFNGADAAFCCLGTTRAQAGSAEAFRKVDLDYVVSSAKVSHEKNIKHYSLVSAINADANSMLLYPQTKGEAEEEIKKIGFPQLSIYRPAGLGEAERSVSRPMERISLALVCATSFMIPKNYQNIPVQSVARAMVRQAEASTVHQQPTGSPIVEVFLSGVMQDMGAPQQNP